MISDYVLLTNDSVTVFKNTSDAFDAYDKYIAAYTRNNHKIPVTRSIFDRNTGMLLMYGDKSVAAVLHGADLVLSEFRK